MSTLTIAPPHLDAPAYSRDAWHHWIDADGNGCDTRYEVLAAEATDGPIDCHRLVGTWRSSYDGVTTSDPSTFDIDHRVPLAEAHRSGGWAWDAATKEAYANDLSDPRTLVAVSASSNRSKGDQDPAGWLPDEDVCGYVADWLAVKARWQLTVDAEEATVLSDLLLGQCAGTTVAPWPPRPSASPSSPTAAALPNPTSTTATTSVLDEGTCQPGYDPCLPITDDIDCGDLAGLGITPPIHVTGPDVYRLDRDHNGVACGK